MYKHRHIANGILAAVRFTVQLNVHAKMAAFKNSVCCNSHKPKPFLPGPLKSR